MKLDPWKLEPAWKPALRASGKIAAFIAVVWMVCDLIGKWVML